MGQSITLDNNPKFPGIALSGFIILMCHPRLYWGEVGNDLTPALFELPVSRNYKHGGWENTTAFFDKRVHRSAPVVPMKFLIRMAGAEVLHFLAAWFLVITGLVYLLTGIFSGHVRKNLWPRANEFTGRMLRLDLINHFRMKFPLATGGPHYGILQKSVYLVVIFFLFPVVVMTGMTMSPAITATYPFLLKIFFGAQSARTIHFFASFALVLFLIVHVVMVIRSGFKQQIRSMTIGK